MRRRGAPAAPATDRLPFLEGLRGLAALYVVLGHFWSMADPSRLAGRTSRAPEWLQSLMRPFDFGHLAVAAFIVISGFCLQLSLHANGTGRLVSLSGFFKRRARRILPPYYACLGLSLIVCVLVTQNQRGMPWALYLPVTWPNVLAHLFLIHNLSLDWMYKINGVLWSIALEAQLYLLFPLLVILRVTAGRFGLLAITSVVAAAIVLLVPGAPKLYPWYLALFSMGMVSAHFSYRPNLRLGTLPWLAVAVAWPAMVGCGYLCATESSLALRDACLGVAVACLIYAWTVRPKFLAARALSVRPLVALGGFSYSLYLMHHPIQQVVYVLRPAGVSGSLLELLYLLLVGLPIILGLTYGFSVWFEQPFISRRRPARETPTPRPTTVTSLPLRTFDRTAPTAVRAVVHGEGVEALGR